MLLRFARAAALFVLAPGLCAVALADTVTFTLNNPTQSGAAGTTFTYTATAAAPLTNTGVEYLNALADNIMPSTAAIFDASGFLFDFPLTLNAGDSYTGTLFTLAFPTTSAVTLYTGSVVLLGGGSDISTDRLGTQDFTANVTPALVATPEPSTWALLATGLTGVFAASRRKRNGAPGSLPA